MNIPGGADEVVRVRWISEFVQEGENIQGAMARARQEFAKAAREQTRNNQMMIRSAKESVQSVEQQQRAEAARMADLRKLSLEEQRIIKGRDARYRDLEKQIARVERAEDRAQAQRKARKAENMRILQDSRNQQSALVKASAADRDQFIKDEKAKTQALRRETQERRRASARVLRRETPSEAEREVARETIKEIDKAIADRTKAQNRAEDLAKRAHLRRVDRINKQGTAEREAIRTAYGRATAAFKTELDKQIQVVRARTPEFEGALKEREDLLKRLTKLREEFGAEVERQLTPRGLRGFGASAPSEEDVARRISRIQTLRSREAIRRSHDIQSAQNAAHRIASEMQTSGRVSETAMNQLEGATRRASLSGKEFNEVTHAAGIHIKDFADRKRTEIRALNNNTQALGQHNTRMGRANQLWSQARSALRLSTNEMILFSRTTRAVAIPAMATFVSLIANLITTLAGGATALTSGLAPAVGQIAGIVPLMASGLQVLSLWKIAMTNLGQTSMSVGRIIQTSLAGSMDQFVLMLKNLPPRVQMFAIQMRQQLAPAFQKIRDDIQKILFPAIFGAVNAAAPGFSGFGKVLQGTAAQIGRMIERIGGSIGSKLFNEDLIRQGNRTNQWIGKLGPAMQRLIASFRELTIAAGPLIDHLVKITNEFAHWLAIQTAVWRFTGQTRRFFELANETFDTTISLLGHFAKALINIGVISHRELGGQMLKDLRGQVLLFERWTTSAKGVKTITDYFRQLKAPLYETARLVRDLAKAFFQVSSNRDFVSLMTQLRTEVLPQLVKMLQTVSKTFAPAMINLITSLFKTIAALGESGGLTSMVKAFTLLSDVIREIAGSPFSRVFFGVLTAIAVFRTLRFAAAISGLTLLLRLVTSVRTGLGLTVFQASRLNEALAARGLARFRPPSVIGPGQIGGVAVSPIQTATTTGRVMFRGGQGAMMMAPSASQPGGFVQTPMTQQLVAQEEAAQAAMRERTLANVLRRNVGLASGVAGVAAGAAGMFMGGKIGNVLTGAGLGAAAGAPFGGIGAVPGAAIGAVVGGLGAFGISLMGAKSQIDKLGESAQKAAEAMMNSREQLRTAISNLRGDAFGVAQTRRQRDVATREFFQLQRRPGVTGAQVEAARLQMQDTRETFRQARERFTDDLRTISQTLPQFGGAKGQFRQDLMKTFGDAQNRLKDTLNAVSVQGLTGLPRQQAITAALEPWNKFLDKIKKDPNADQTVKSIADNLERISKTDLPAKKVVEFQLKTIGPPAFWQWVFGHSRELREGTLQIGDFPSSTPAGNRPTRRAYGGRIPGVRMAADSVPAMLSPQEFVVTGSGERMLEQMTFPGVLDYVEQRQMPHFNTGGRVRRFARGGRVLPFDFLSAGDDALRSAIGSTGYQQIVSQAIDQTISAMASLDTQETKSKAGDLPPGTPKSIRGRLTNMMIEARKWMKEAAKKAPGVIPDATGRLLTSEDYRRSKVTGVTGLDPGVIISDIIRAGYGFRFPLANPNAFFALRGSLLESKGSKYLTVLVRPGTEREYDAAIKIGKRGFGFSGNKFTNRDMASMTGWWQFHLAGWPMRRGGRVGMQGGGRAGPRFRSLPPDEQRRRILIGFQRGRLTFGKAQDAFTFWHLGSFRDYVRMQTDPAYARAHAPGIVQRPGGTLDLPPRAERTPGGVYGSRLMNLIRRLAPRYGLDPQALLSVASVEGKFAGAAGDKGTSFGPFQLHAGGALPVPIGQGRAYAQSRAGIEYALRQISGVARGQSGLTAIESIVRNFERPSDPEAEIGRAMQQYLTGGSARRLSGAGAPTGPPPSYGGPAAAPIPRYGMIAQARTRVQLTALANRAQTASVAWLTGFADNLRDQLKDLQGRLLQAQLSGKKKLADQLGVEITKIQSELGIVEGAVGKRIESIGRAITQAADRITGMTDVVQNRIERMGLDPAGAQALRMTQRTLDRTSQIDRMQLRRAQNQLALARRIHAPQDVIDQYTQSVATARRDLRGAVTAAVLGRRAIVRRRFERGETRAAGAEQFAQLGLEGLQTRQSIAGTFDTGGGERAAYIRQNIIPALQKQAAAVEDSLKHARQQRLTEDEKRDKQIQLAQINNQIAAAQLQAQQEANSILNKSLGKLTFEFNNQTWNDMIGSGVGV